jgi:uncharacterized protein YndB with AHSA1/START domain
MKPAPLIIEQTFPSPIEKVWKAITDKDQIKEWFFPIKEFKPEIGFEFQFDGGKDDVRYRHLCKITELIPGKKLTYSWRYEGFAGNSFVSFELFDEGDHTRLRLTHEGLETLPISRPGFLNGYYIPAWEEMVSISLKQFLE